VRIDVKIIMRKILSRFLCGFIALLDLIIINPTLTITHRIPGHMQGR